MENEKAEAPRELSENEAKALARLSQTIHLHEYHSMSYHQY